MLLAGAVLAQGPSGTPQPSAPSPSHAQFFAGSVVELDATHIKVTRTLVGRPTEIHSFSINAATKMPKTAIKPHGRVTVRYKHGEDGDIAVEIEPRPVTTHLPKG
jgi:hypothetical protein